MIKNDEVRVNGSDYINEAWKDKASTKKALLETIGHPDPYKEPNSRFVGKSWEIKDLFSNILEFLDEKGYKAVDIPDKLKEYRQVYEEEKDGRYIHRTLVFPDLAEKFSYLMRCSRMYTMNLDYSDNVGTDGKPLNSRPKILADCIRRLESVKEDLEQLQTEYEEWSSNINEGATQDKCNDAEAIIGDQACTVDDVLSELEGIESELPMGFGRD